jgi:hypothetical protein
MKWWIKLGCFLTGWNYGILCHCGEASFKHLKKFTSALLILMIIWGVTGWCFADRYVKAPWWGCLLTAFVFIVIVIQIERQIILTIGKNYWSKVLRIVVAVLMAVLSSTTLDQMIFGDDIDKKKIEVRDRQVLQQLPNRLTVIDEKLQQLGVDIDSLDKSQIVLNEDIAQRPNIPKTSTEITYTRELRSDSTFEEVPHRKVKVTQESNPRIRQVETNEKTLDGLRKQQEEYTQKKMQAEDNLRKELDKAGFLEELDVMIMILSESMSARLFGISLFLFLLFLELFVVISKLTDDECDYDAIVKYQMERKKLALGELEKTESMKSTI